MKTKIKRTTKRAIADPHRRAIRSIFSSTIIAARVVLGFAALGDRVNLWAQDDLENGLFDPIVDAGVHETRAEPLDARHFSNPNEASTAVEGLLPAPSTRSSFMATWPAAVGATGYLLDVSTSPAFDSYVDGYHDLEVGNITGSVVTGLNPGTTYYYRVRAYDAIEIGEYSGAMTGTTVPSTG